MASDRQFVEFVADQIENAGRITYRAMFGEYGLFSDGRIFGVICNNRLFIKPTESGRAFIKDVVEAPPYKGAKLSFLIEENLEDREWLSTLVRITLSELQVLKPKK